MDWRFVDDGNWGLVHGNLNGAGVESMSTKWDELFGVKKQVVVEEVMVKKLRKKAVVKKAASKKTTIKKTPVSKGPRSRKLAQ